MVPILAPIVSNPRFHLSPENSDGMNLPPRKRANRYTVGAYQIGNPHRSAEHLFSLL
jgi:hypothetical protein